MLAISYILQGGDKIPRKGGPGISQSDLLVINKVSKKIAPLFSISAFESNQNVSCFI